MYNEWCVRVPPHIPDHASPSLTPQWAAYSGVNSTVSMWLHKSGRGWLIQNTETGVLQCD